MDGTRAYHKILQFRHIEILFEKHVQRTNLRYEEEEEGIQRITSSYLVHQKMYSFVTDSYYFTQKE